MTHSKPTILFPHESMEGDFVTFSCGKPLPVIRWYDSAGPITTHSILLLQPPAAGRSPVDNAIQLTLSRPGSSNLYIQASSELGSAMAETILTVGESRWCTAYAQSEAWLFLSPRQSLMITHSQAHVNHKGERPTLQKKREDQRVRTIFTVSSLHQWCFLRKASLLLLLILTIRDLNRPLTDV